MDEREFPLVSVKNKGKWIYSHYPSHKEDDPFTAGFLEAMDFLQYVDCHFSIYVAHELWPPSNQWELENNVRDGVIVRNHFWDKYRHYQKCVNRNCDELNTINVGAYAFYNSLDYCARAVLYHWYKRNVGEITDIFGEEK